MTLHFGLGYRVSLARVEVVWPSHNITVVLNEVPSNQTLFVIRPTGANSSQEERYVQRVLIWS